MTIQNTTADRRAVAMTLSCLLVLLMGSGMSVAQNMESNRDRRLQLLSDDIQYRVEPKAWDGLVADPATAKFLEIFTTDEQWMGDFLDSGPVAGTERALRFLAQVWTDDQGVRQPSAARSMATACALEHGRGNGEMGGMIRRYLYFIESHRGGLLNSCFETLATWERRFLARGAQWGMVNELEGMRFLRDTASLPRSMYPKVCWRAPYRLHNGLGDSVHRPLYYAPFNGSYESRVEMVYDVGGVCGALSNSGASAAIANGIPAATMGEPGHCAYVVKTSDETWTPSYSLSWKRSLHSYFFHPSWSSLMLTEGCFGDRDAMTRAGDLGRQARVEVRRKRVKRADTLYAKALRAHPLHHGLWLEWAVFGKQQEMSVAWWRRFHAALLEGLVEHQDIAWSVLTKHVYPALRPHLQPTEQANLFFKFIDSQTGWGRGRWPAEGAWNWLRTQLPKKQQGAFVRRISKRMTPTKEFGSLAVSWVLGLHPKPGPARESALEMLVKDIGKDTKASKSQMIHLAKLVVPRAAADGDSALFQSFGRTVAHLSKKVPIAGVKPFSGQLLSDGGTLLVSGGGNRYDRPVGHWGVLRPGGGYSHTSKGPCSIAVRLECQAKLRGVIVQNVPGLKQSRAEGARVEISDDGKVWRPIATLEGNRPVYKIDFKEKDHNCLWVRIAKDTEYLHFSHFLVYGRRRS